MACDTGSAATRRSMSRVEGITGAVSSSSRHRCTEAPSYIRDTIRFRVSAMFGVVNTRGGPKSRV